MFAIRVLDLIHNGVQFVKVLEPVYIGPKVLNSNQHVFFHIKRREASTMLSVVGAHRSCSNPNHHALYHCH